MNEPVLACYGLAKSFSDGLTKVVVLREINLSLNAGEIIAIVGASGSGKSTLLHLLGGLERPSAGKVVLNGADIAQLSAAQLCKLRNCNLGFVYQFHHLLPEFSALENVSMPLLIRGLPPAEIKERALSLLSVVGLEQRTTHRLGQLSGGERQRVAIARALVGNPLCILADEPTGNLDPENAKRILELFFQLQIKQATSAIIVTHDLEIARHAQRILRLEQGQLVALE